MAELQLDCRTAIAQLTIVNPPANTWNIELLDQLTVLCQDIAANPAVRAVVVTGSGERFFSAGADLKQFADGNATAASEVAEAFGRAFEALAALPVPTVAAIQGFAMGGGLEVALACDFRVAEPAAVLALPEAAVGLLPCAGGTQRLRQLAGQSWAKRMILLGERVGAATAVQIGLVDRLADTGQARALATEWMQSVVRQSPASVRACKQLIQLGHEVPLSQTLAAERAYFMQLFAGSEAKEGVTAFLDKRLPAWCRPESKDLT